MTQDTPEVSIEQPQTTSEVGGTQSRSSSEGDENTSESNMKWVPKPEAARILAGRNGRSTPYSDKWMRELEKRGAIETKRERGRVFVKVELTSEPEEDGPEPTSEVKRNSSELTSALLDRIEKQHEFLREQLEQTQEELRNSNDALRKKDEELAYARRQLDAVTGFVIASLMPLSTLPNCPEATSEFVLKSEPDENAEISEKFTADTECVKGNNPNATSEVKENLFGTRPVTIRGGKRPNRFRLAWRVLLGKEEVPA